MTRSQFSTLLTRSALALLAATTSLFAEPGDDHHTYSSTDTSFFPPYSTVVQFGDPVSGGSTPDGYQSAAYRFTAQVSGPMEYIQVILYAPSGYDPSARVVLYTDAGGKVGEQMAAYNIGELTLGHFSGYFPYHNYEQLGPGDTTILLTKGKSYWLSVEPAVATSYVYWAQSLETKTVKKYRNVGGNVTYSSSSGDTPAGFTVAVFEPFPPQVQDPGTPLVEGAQVPGEDQGVTLGSVGTVPQTPCLGSIVVSKKKVPVILGADGKVKLRVGEAAPTLAGTAIKTLSDPSGDLVLATLQHRTAAPVITAANDTVLIGGVQTPPLRIVAQSGDRLTGGNGANIGRFLSFDGGGTSSFFLTQLTGTGVSGKNNLALAAAVGTAAAHVLVRKDDLVGDFKVTTIGTLVSAADSAAEGRWRASGNALGVELTLADKSNHLFTIPASAASQMDWVAWSATGVPLAAPLQDAVITTLGIPGFGPDGVIFPATLKVGPGGVKSTDNLVLLHQTAAGFTVLARKGADAPDADGNAMEGVGFKTFGHPVYGPAGQVAFLATLTAKTNPAGLWYLDGVNPLHLVVRAGDPAPTFSTFSKFTKLIFPNAAGSKPIFEAKLATAPTAGVTGTSSDGVWAVNSVDDVVLVVCNGNYCYLNGDTFGTLSGISVLTTTAKSPGAAHGVDADGSVRLNATIINPDKKVAKKKLQFSVPVPGP